MDIELGYVFFSFIYSLNYLINYIGYMNGAGAQEENLFRYKY